MKAVVEQFGAAYHDVEALVDQLMAETRPPRALDDLLDLLAGTGVGPGSLVLDAGASTGRWVPRLKERFGCDVIALDLVHPSVVDAAKDGAPAVTADVQRLPFQTSAFDGVWCRDMLSCVEDPFAALREFARVLTPGGVLLLYAAFPTAELEPRERRRLLSALDSPAWWGEGQGPVNDAIGAAGLEIEREEPISPEHQERAMLDRGDLTHDLAVLGRLQRERARFEDEMGTIWYERWRAWTAWAPYLLLGKLQTTAWVLRKP